jgi:hypothetical protein
MIAKTVFFNRKYNWIDRIYYSFSLEFWLSIATVALMEDWIFKFGKDSLLLTIIWSGIIATYSIFTNRTAGQLWHKIRSIKAPQNTLLLLSGLTFLSTAFIVNCTTDPSHALIITASGATAIKGILSGATFTGTALTAGAASTGATTAGTFTAFAEGVIVLIKVLFALAFIFALYQSYQKYNERAELQEIVQSPVVLMVVVIAIDGVLQLMLGAT